MLGALDALYAPVGFDGLGVDPVGEVVGGVGFLAQFGGGAATVAGTGVVGDGGKGGGGRQGAAAVRLDVQAVLVLGVLAGVIGVDGAGGGLEEVRERAGVSGGALGEAVVVEQGAGREAALVGGVAPQAGLAAERQTTSETDTARSTRYSHWCRGGDLVGGQRPRSRGAGAAAPGCAFTWASYCSR